VGSVAKALARTRPAGEAGPLARLKLIQQKGEILAMKRYTTVLSLLLVCLVLLAFSSNPRAFMQRPDGDAPATPALAPDTKSIPTGGGMPPRALPSRPIPHHEPGHPAKAANYNTQVRGINAKGMEEIIQLAGLDALMADGTMDDPLQGNYRLVNLDKLMWSSYHDLNYLDFAQINGNLQGRQQGREPRT